MAGLSNSSLRNWASFSCKILPFEFVSLPRFSSPSSSPSPHTWGLAAMSSSGPACHRALLSFQAACPPRLALARQPLKAICFGPISAAARWYVLSPVGGAGLSQRRHLALPCLTAASAFVPQER